MAVGRGFTLPENQGNQATDSSSYNGVERPRTLAGDNIFFITASAAEVGSSEARHFSHLHLHPVLRSQRSALRA